MYTCGSMSSFPFTFNPYDSIRSTTNRFTNGIINFSTTRATLRYKLNTNSITKSAPSVSTDFISWEFIFIVAATLNMFSTFRNFR